MGRVLGKSCSLPGVVVGAVLADMDFWSPAGGAFGGVADLTAVDVAVLVLGSGAVSFAEWLSCGLLLESVDQEKRRHIVVCEKEEGRARQAVSMMRRRNG